MSAGERMSDREAFQLAASLPPEAPHILADHFFGESSGSDTTEAGSATPMAAGEGGEVTVIDIDKYEDDLRDPEWQAFQRAALAHVEKLRREGRSD